tara:strand:+ start:1298 stop:1501 length:204 start_codon:yes stop_codon:yes gene_type:complete
MKRTVNIRIGSVESAEKMLTEAKEIIDNITNLSEEKENSKLRLKFTRAHTRFRAAKRYLKKHKQGKN